MIFYFCRFEKYLQEFSDSRVLKMFAFCFPNLIWNDERDTKIVLIMICDVLGKKNEKRKSNGSVNLRWLSLNIFVLGSQTFRALKLSNRSSAIPAAVFLHRWTFPISFHDCSATTTLRYNLRSPVDCGNFISNFALLNSVRRDCTTLWEKSINAQVCLFTSFTNAPCLYIYVWKIK